MTSKPLKTGYTKEGFSDYLDSVVKHSMGAWRPRGFVLHNTFNPTLAMVDQYIISKKWTMEQLVDNWWQTYVHAGWPSGPHMFIYRNKIHLGERLWMPGTHSPSWNHTHWGIEMVGNFSVEKFPDDTKFTTLHAGASLLAMLGHPADDSTFHFHGEDPGTSHKNCPGKNVGMKAIWIKNLNATMRAFNPGQHTVPVPAPTVKTLPSQLTVELPPRPEEPKAAAPGFWSRLAEALGAKT